MRRQRASRLVVQVAHDRVQFVELIGVEAGASVICTSPYATTAADLAAGHVSGTVTASGIDPAGLTVTATTTPFLSAVAAPPALTLTKAASPTTYAAAARTSSTTSRPRTPADPTSPT